MAQEARSEERWSGSPLHGVVLAVLLEQQGRELHGYGLATLVMRRLGPAWGVTRQSVYRALESLEKKGLVRSAEKPGIAADGDRRGQRVFRATRHAESARAAWMGAPMGKGPVRGELYARIAVSHAQDVPQLLRALDGCEQACFQALCETEEAEVPMGSWSGLAKNLTRAAADKRIQAELGWIAQARQWIADFLKEQSSESER